jgi:hypothetical protein
MLYLLFYNCGVYTITTKLELLQSFTLMLRLGFVLWIAKRAIALEAETRVNSADANISSQYQRLEVARNNKAHSKMWHRSLTANQTVNMNSKRFPDIFLLGVPKASTTSLHHLLVSHPEICDIKNKEIGFFIHHHDTNAIQYFDKYAELFFKCGANMRTIDSTPGYFELREAAALMNTIYSGESLYKKKFIVILREPVERGKSKVSDPIHPTSVIIALTIHQSTRGTSIKSAFVWM